MEAALYQEMKEKIDRLIMEEGLASKRIFLFGHCNATEEMLGYLLRRGLTVQSILDNNESKTQTLCQGVPIRKPAAEDLKAEKVVVLIAARAYAAMEAQLRRLGFEGRIYKVVDYNSFAEYSLSEETLERRQERIQRGQETLRRLRQKPWGRYLVLCPYPALGDVYYAMAYLPVYLEQRGGGEYLAAVVGNACGQVAEMFGVRHIEVLERETMEELIQAVLFSEEEDCTIAHHDRPYTNDMIEYLRIRNLPFSDFYKYGVYGLKREAKMAVPCNLREFSEKKRLKKGRTVIFSPYAKSMVGLPEAFWQKAVSNFSSKGFAVFTNVANGEMPLKNTRPIEIPLAEMISAVEYAGIFLGIRSGLCDVVQTARCRKIVVFPKVLYSTTAVAVSKFFELPGWETVLASEGGYGD